jgi:hypothetical protein
MVAHVTGNAGVVAVSAGLENFARYAAAAVRALSRYLILSAVFTYPLLQRGSATKPAPID